MRWREARWPDDVAMAHALLAMSVTELQQQFCGWPMKRAKRRGLSRTAAIVLGNVGTRDDVPLLEAQDATKSRRRHGGGGVLPT